MEKQFYTIVDKITGKEHRGQFEGDNVADDEIEITEKRTEYMINPYFNFETREFYQGEIQE
jgi:hypothetical protein